MRACPNNIAEPLSRGGEEEIRGEGKPNMREGQREKEREGKKGVGMWGK